MIWTKDSGMYEAIEGMNRSETRLQLQAFIPPFSGIISLSSFHPLTPSLPLHSSAD